MTRIVFEEIRDRREHKTKCRGCGKFMRRVLKTYQTLNPFNRNSDGFQKSVMEIRKENEAKLDKQVAELERTGIRCSKCG